mmetsp:Transcript_18154/g.59850  ORF Transcript_18154/g.59850 Transcript_18154/m.59850 type:complete len:273 (+) Transcript_18154:2625-3443(+)
MLERARREQRDRLGGRRVAPEQRDGAAGGGEEEGGAVRGSEGDCGSVGRRPDAELSEGGGIEQQQAARRRLHNGGAAGERSCKHSRALRVEAAPLLHLGQVVALLLVARHREQPCLRHKRQHQPCRGDAAAAATAAAATAGGVQRPHRLDAGQGERRLLVERDARTDDADRAVPARARAGDDLPLPLPLGVEDREVDDRAEVLPPRQLGEVRAVLVRLRREREQHRVGAARAEVDDAVVEVADGGRGDGLAEPLERERRHLGAVRQADGEHV